MRYAFPQSLAIQRGNTGGWTGINSDE